MPNYSGRQALLLGGSAQLALSLAEAMIPLGLYPTLTYRNDDGKARIEKYLDGYAGRFSTRFLDLGTVDNAALNASLGGAVDYLVDYAQGDIERLVASMDPGVARDYFQANVANRSLVIQRVVRDMVVRKQGRLVHISSAAVRRANPGQGFYAAAKSAVEALYRQVGIEMAGRGITTVTLRPGYVDAGRGSRFLETHGEAGLAKVPMGRALTVEEVTAAVMFLLSDEAAGFNAAELTMDGGLGAVK